jgi:acyl-coenzyme A synthetase/AMP-(fatty) acid ligase
VAAVSHPVEGQGEQLIVLAERDTKHPVPEAELAEAIQNRLVSALPVAPYLVQILAPGTLPRTSSGKLRRADALRLYLDRQLVPPDKVTSLKLFLELGKSQLAWGRFTLRNRK